jgi:hypothetical protein
MVPMSSPSKHLIDSIMYDVGLKDAKVKSVSAKVSLQVHVFKDKPTFDLNFNYRSAVGKRNYLAQTTRPDIMHDMRQIAKEPSDPRQSHGEAIIYLVCYLIKMHNLDSSSILILRKVLYATVMQICQEIRTRNLHPWIPVLPSHEADGSSSTQDAPSPGPPNFKFKLRCLSLRPSTLPCCKCCVTSFPL